MTTFLNLTLPSLKAGQEPVTFTMPAGVESPTSPMSPSANSAQWVQGTEITPQGLAFCQRVELMYALRGEDDRMRVCRVDPNAAAQWTAKADEADVESSASDADCEGEQADARTHTSRKKKFTKLSDDDLLVDWYDVLKLENADAATDEQVKLAYRKRCLETHPDKQPDRSDELFKQVQRAFDILNDPDVRQTFDSSRPFDDAIPGENIDEAKFFAAFGPVFDRNKKWSVERDLPSLGTDGTTHKDVLRFYDRWTAYQSWRDFSHLADLDEIDESMCREEKRFYMRENERQVSHFRKEEQKRLRTLVERARKADPRLRRKREADEAKRRQEQAEREAFRQKLRDEDDRKRNEVEARERLKKEEAAKAVVDTKAAMRQAQASMLEFLKTHDILESTPTNKLLVTAVRRPNVTWLFSKVTTLEEGAEIIETVRGGCTERRPLSADTRHADGATEEIEAVLLFNELVEIKERQIGLTRYGESIKKVAPPEQKPQSAAAKAKAAKAAEPEWTEDDMQRLQKATTKFPPGTVERWSKISAAIRDRFTEEQCMGKVNELAAALAAGVTPSVGATSAANAAEHAEQAEIDAAAAAAAGNSVEEWTVKQQKLLEQGLRELKDYKEKDKFQKIALIVESKTAKECFERFKYLRDMMKSK